MPDWEGILEVVTDSPWVLPVVLVAVVPSSVAWFVKRRLSFERPDPGVPRRVSWVALSWVLFLVLTAVAALDTVAAVRDAPPVTTFDSGEQVDVRVGPATHLVIYASGRSGRVACRLMGPDQASLTRPNRGDTLRADGAAWHLAFEIDAPQPGNYGVTCEGAGMRFRVGPDLFAVTIDAIISRIVLPAVGLLAVLVATVAVRTVRRRQISRK